MKQEQFERERRALWKCYEVELQTLEKRRKRSKRGGEPEDFPSMYRAMSNDLSIARERRFRPALLENLNALVLRGHHLLYRNRPTPFVQVLEFFAGGFPAMVRARWPRFVFCLLFFYVPFLLLWYAGGRAPEWVLALLPESMMSSMDSMHGPGNDWEDRSLDEGFRGWAYYVRNNVGIAFRVFAGGILAGVGALFILGYNGLILGGAFGYIVYAGNSQRFVAFVSGHSALELTGIVLSALAGLELGLAWLLPGRRTRRYALVEGAKDALKLLMGAATMVTLAAIIEANWSPSIASDRSKHIVGIVLWVAVILYLALAGRRRADRELPGGRRAT